MKLYEVEFRAVITLAAQDIQKATLHGTGVIKESPHLIYVKAVHERNFKPAFWMEKIFHLRSETVSGRFPICIACDSLDRCPPVPAPEKHSRFYSRVDHEKTLPTYFERLKDASSANAYATVSSPGR